MFFISFLFFAQAPSIAWQKRIGSDKYDFGSSIKPTSDGGFIIGGRSHSNAFFEKTSYNRGGSDYWIVKTDSQGNIEWDKTIGGAQTPGLSPSYEFEILTTIFQTPDGGYFVAGSSSSPMSGEKTESSRGSYDYWVLKLSSTGAIEWQKTIGGNVTEKLWSAIYTQDGGYLLSGNSFSNASGEKSEDSRGDSDMWIVKLSGNGSIEWQKTIGGAGRDGVTDAIQNQNGTFTMVGSSDSNISGEKTENNHGGADVWILTLDNLGNILYQKTIGGSASDAGYGIIATTDGNYLIAATSNSNISGDKTENCKGGQDIWIIKTDYLFNIMWQKTFGGNKDEGLKKPLQTFDNGYLISSISLSGISGDKITALLGSSDAWLLKLAPDGQLYWQKTIGGNASGIYRGSDSLVDFMQSADGGFVLFGNTDSDISGDIVDFSRGDDDYWLVKLNPENLSTLNFNSEDKIQLLPNPAINDISIIENSGNQEDFLFKIIDVTGRIIIEGKTSTNEKINIGKLVIGNYFIKLERTSGIESCEKFFKY